MKVLSALVGLLSLAAASPATAQNLASGKPVSMIVGASPGGSTDFSARLLAEPLSKALGSPVVVENKPGASGNLATAQVARARPDGHTLLMQYSGYHVGNPHLFDSLNWKASDLTPVALVTFSPHIVAAHPDVKASSLKELADLAKANPGTIKYGTAGIGSIQHMATELLAQQTGTKMVHLPYKGAGPAVTDLLGGRLDIVNTTPPSLVPHIKAGKLKALAYTGRERHADLPQVPTVIEAGLPQLALDPGDWTGIVAPAGTPPAVISALNAAINEILEVPEVRANIARQGGTVKRTTPSEFTAFVAAEAKKWPPLVKAAKLKED